jgi:hypothetical protein
LEEGKEMNQGFKMWRLKNGVYLVGGYEERQYCKKSIDNAIKLCACIDA